MPSIDYEFEYPIQCADHVIGYVEGHATLVVWGRNLRVSQILLLDADSREHFTLDPTTALAKEITTWLMQHKHDVLEERLLEIHWKEAVMADETDLSFREWMNR